MKTPLFLRKWPHDVSTFEEYRLVVIIIWLPLKVKVYSSPNAAVGLPRKSGKGERQGRVCNRLSCLLFLFCLVWNPAWVMQLGVITPTGPQA